MKRGINLDERLRDHCLLEAAPELLAAVKGLLETRSYEAWNATSPLAHKRVLAAIAKIEE